MKYYRINGNVTAYEADGSQDAYIPAHAVAMTAEEVEAHINPPKTEADLVAAIKARRDQAIESGTVVGGISLYTDERSRNFIDGAALSALMDPDYSLRWLAADGNVHVLTAPQVLALASGVRAHVQACFDVAEAKVAALLNGDEYDLEADWP